MGTVRRRCAGMSAASSSFAGSAPPAGPGGRKQATKQSGAAFSMPMKRSYTPSRSPAPDPDTAKPQDLFPSPPSTPKSGAIGRTGQSPNHRRRRGGPVGPSSEGYLSRVTLLVPLHGPCLLATSLLL